jgi:hypothetical protein
MGVFLAVLTIGIALRQWVEGDGEFVVGEEVVGAAAEAGVHLVEDLLLFLVGQGGLELGEG